MQHVTAQVNNPRLTSLYKRIDNCRFCLEQGNKLKHILGIGQSTKPNVALILINPTYRNISAGQTELTWRFPFVGVRSFWQVMFNAGLISQDTFGLIYKNEWSEKTLRKIRSELEAKGIYITNFSKCTRKDSLYPAKETLDYHEKILKEELVILNPKLILTFGLLPFKRLTGLSINLNHYYNQVLAGDTTRFPLLTKFGLRCEVIPSYFPTGRGSPKRAAVILSKVL
jgi:hypothetical protein